MNANTPYQKTIATLNTLYRYIEFHGVYVQYSQSIKLLASLLNITDAAELHYIMMHLSNLSYFKDRQGKYLWCSKYFIELFKCNSLNGVSDQSKNMLDENALYEFFYLEKAVLRAEKIESTIISSKLKGYGDFTCHAKVYPVYDAKGTVIGSLTILAEIKTLNEYAAGLESNSNEINESTLLV